MPNRTIRSELRSLKLGRPLSGLLAEIEAEAIRRALNRRGGKASPEPVKPWYKRLFGRSA